MTDLPPQTKIAYPHHKKRDMFDPLLNDLPCIIYQLQWTQDRQIQFNYISDYCQESLGLSAIDIQTNAQTFLNSIDPPDRDALLTVLAQANETKQPWKWIGKVFTTSGEIKWLKGISRQPCGTNIWNGIFVDISERKSVEHQLRQQEEQYRSIFEVTLDGMTILNLDTGRLIAANPAMCEMHGYTAEEFILLHPSQFIHPDSLSTFGEFLQTLRSGKNFQIEALDIRKDGTPFEVEVKASPYWIGDQIYAMSTIRDISQRVRADKERRESQKLLQIVIDTIPQVVFWKDRNLNYLGCNRHLAAIAGLDDPRDIIGKTDYDLPWTREESDSYRAYDRAVMEQGEPQLHIIEQQHQLDGTVNWLDTNKIPLRNDQGEIIGIIGTLEDISDRKRIEIERQQAEQQLRQKTASLEQALHDLGKAQAQVIQSEKMSSLGQLVAGVAHEINNPVSFIYSNLQPARSYIKDLLHLISLYQRYYPQPDTTIQTEIDHIDLDFLIEDLPKLLTSMQTGAERIREIVLSLRIFSRLDESEYKKADIHAGIDSSLMILQHRLRATDQHPAIAVIKQYDSLPQVECYAGRLNQVFMNLLVNAIDALEESFQVNPDLIPKILVTTEVTNRNSVIIRITDNGTGMSEETLLHIFDPFFTTKPIGVGTGMGLAISYQIVTEQHGGSLICCSQIGQGTEFMLEIPLTQAAST